MTWSRDCELFTLQGIFFPGMQTINNCRNWSHAGVTWGNNVIFCLAAAASLSKDVACFFSFFFFFSLPPSCDEMAIWQSGHRRSPCPLLCSSWSTMISDTKHCSNLRQEKVSTWDRVLIPLSDSQKACSAVCPAQPAVLAFHPRAQAARSSESMAAVN